MKILLFYTYNQGHLSAFFSEICNMLSIEGHNVKVFCLKRYPHKTKNTLFHIKIKQRRNLITDYWEIFNIIRSERPNVIVSNFRYVNPALFFGKILGIKTNLAWFHSLNEQMHPSRKKVLIKIIFLKFADILIANSHLTAVDLNHIYNVNFKKIKTLPFWSAIDNKLIDFNKNSSNCIKGKVILGCPGRMVAHKNQKVVIKALARLKDMGNTNYEIHFAGEGPELNNLIDLVKHFNVEDEIKFLGNLSQVEMISFYQSCDIVILPSLHEAFGLVFIEAISLGTPVIVSEAFGALGFISDKTNLSLITFEPTSNEELEQRILDFKENKYLTEDFFKNLYRDNFKKEIIYNQFKKILLNTSA